MLLSPVVFNVASNKANYIKAFYIFVSALFLRNVLKRYDWLEEQQGSPLASFSLHEEFTEP